MGRGLGVDEAESSFISGEGVKDGGGGAVIGDEGVVVV